MGIGIGFDHMSARHWWQELKRVYLDTDRPRGGRRSTRRALNNRAVRVPFEDLLAFVDDERLGQTRIYFLRAITRIGNRIQAGQGSCR